VEIDPRGLTLEHMETFRKAGFNRISMGIQDFNPVVQKAVNRIQSEEITHQAIDWSRKLMFKSINVDLIYGLPHQTAESFEKTINKTISFSCDRVVVFNFAYVPWLKPHQKILKPHSLPTPEEKLKILKMSIERLTSAGYVYIGMDHFAKPDDELAVAQRQKTLHRNFQGYSTRADADLYGFGVSSISHLSSKIYAQNEKDITSYQKRIAQGELPIILGYKMSQDDVIRKFVITRIMCDLELSKLEVEKRFGIRFDSYFSDSLTKLNEFVEDDLLEIKADVILVKNMGRFIIRNIAMCFDNHLEKIVKEKPIFSRTV
jgi:oxygen-independent coproporphyrinogen-3 oxidase